MDTLQDAINFLQHNETPFWWLSSGNSKMGQNIKEDDINLSVALLKTTVALLPSGNYKLECSANKNDRSGSFKFPFTKGNPANSQTSTSMAPSNNAYNIPDHVLKQVQEDARFRLIVEGMAAKFDKFMDEWPEYKRKIDTLWADEDGDGTPDFLQSFKTVSELAETGKKFKSILD